MSESVSESVSDKGTYRAVRGQLKIRMCANDLDPKLSRIHGVRGK